LVIPIKAWHKRRTIELRREALLRVLLTYGELNGYLAGVVKLSDTVTCWWNTIDTLC
jgi:hypothetical protein